MDLSELPETITCCGVVFSEVDTLEWAAGALRLYLDATGWGAGFEKQHSFRCDIVGVGLSADDAVAAARLFPRWESEFCVIAAGGSNA